MSFEGSGARADYSDLRVKHLELVQSVISRMSGQSGAIKRLAVIFAAAAISFAKVASAPSVFWLAAGLVLVLGLLDAQYLRIERAFRDLYDEVRSEDPARRPDFRLDPPKDGRRFLKAVCSWPVLGLYGILMLFLVVLPLLVEV